MKINSQNNNLIPENDNSISFVGSQPETKPAIITPATYKSFIQMIEKIKNCDSWCGKMEPHSGFSKELKEALNILIFACIKDIMLPPDIDLSAFPAFIVKRLYRKSYTWDAKPENTQYLRGKVPHLDILLENHAYKMLLAERIDGEGVAPFAEFIWSEAAKFPAEAHRVFRAAKVIGTLVEYELMASKLRFDTVEETRERVLSDLKKYYDLPHFTEIVEGIGKYGKLKKLFRIISEGARNRHRWQMFYDRKNCFSILAHMLETALIGYLANLELGRETDVLKDFWVLLFHDIAEIWTDDIPSPVKDCVRIWDPVAVSDLLYPEYKAAKDNMLAEWAEKMERTHVSESGYPYFRKEKLIKMIEAWEVSKEDGLRIEVFGEHIHEIKNEREWILWDVALELCSEWMEVTDETLRSLSEEMEREALERYFYPLLPEPCAEFFRNGVMLEDINVGDGASEELKREIGEMRKFYKSADYFSADVEVFLNIQGGSHNGSWRDILERSVLPKSNRTPCELVWLNGIVEKCKHIVFF